LFAIAKRSEVTNNAKTMSQLNHANASIAVRTRHSEKPQHEERFPQ